jgi:hypothetical protein
MNDAHAGAARAAWRLVVASFVLTGCGSGGLAGTGKPVGNDSDSGFAALDASRTGGGGAGISEGGGTNATEGGTATPDSASNVVAGAGDGGTGDTGTTGAAEGGSDGGSIACGAHACSPKQQCDPTLGCVDCTSGAQCPASAAICLAGACVQCMTNADCGTGTTPACWLADHTCHAPCTSSQQCQNGNNASICNTSTGACVGCNSGTDCPSSRKICDSATAQCVECSSNADCAGTSTPACSRNQCVACATNADCSGTTPYCNTAGDNGPRCAQCLQDAHCPASAPKCNGGTCGQSGG